MSRTKADLSGWDLRYDDLADAAGPGDELTMYKEKEGGRGRCDRTLEWTATVESVGPREMTMDDGRRVESSSLDVVLRNENGYGRALDRVVVR